MIGSVEKSGYAYWQIINLPIARITDLERQPVHLHSSFNLEIVSDVVKRRISPASSAFYLSKAVLCRTFQEPDQDYLTCRQGLEPFVETDVHLESSNRPPSIVLTLFPRNTPWGLSPTSELGTAGTIPSHTGSDEYAFIPRRKIAEVQTALDASEFPLSQYILPD